jgi:hypothetical protein
VDAAGRAPTTGVRGADAIAVPAGGLIAGGLIPVGAATPKEPAGKPAGKRVRPKYTPPDVGDPTAQLSDSVLTSHVAPPRGAARLYRLPQDPSQELVCSPLAHQLQARHKHPKEDPQTAEKRQKGSQNHDNNNNCTTTLFLPIRTAHWFSLPPSPISLLSVRYNGAHFWHVIW